MNSMSINDTNRESLGQDYSMDMQNIESNNNCIKVIVITVACSDQLSHIWDTLRDCLINQLDGYIGSPYEKDIMICININNNGQKLKASSYDKTSSDNWLFWRDNFDIGKLNQDDLLLQDMGHHSQQIKKLNNNFEEL
jgi:hypothetical protein